MKKLILLLSLFLTLQVSGQVGIFASQGVVVAGGGSEMITNGAIGDGTSWFKLQVDGGVATWDAGGYVLFTYSAAGYCWLGQYQVNMVSPVVISTAYTLTFDFTISGGTSYIVIQGTDGQVYVSEAAYTTTGNKTVNFTTPGSLSAGGLRISCQRLASGTTAIDNVSLVPQ